MSDRTPGVLFLCTHNAGRSQMAMAFLRHLAGDRASVYSAGSEPADEVNRAAVEAMAEKGIDISGEQPKRWTTDMVEAVDVVVTDGFTGNVALKTGEGALKLMRDLLRQVFTSSVPARLGYLLARPALDRLREWMDPRRYNGAILLGLNGVVVKSHGGTDALGFAHAVDVAMDMVNHRFNDRIREGLARLSAAVEAEPAAAALAVARLAAQREARGVPPLRRHLRAVPHRRKDYRQRRTPACLGCGLHHVDGRNASSPRTADMPVRRHAHYLHLLTQSPP